MPAVPFSGRANRRAAQKGAEMLKKIMTDVREAVLLIATENLSALRAMLKNIANWASKSARTHHRFGSQKSEAYPERSRRVRSRKSEIRSLS